VAHRTSALPASLSLFVLRKTGKGLLRGEVEMTDTTVKKVSGASSPKGAMGQVYLASGKRVSMRLWRDEEPQAKGAVRRDYETVGYVIAGRAELTL
jgi:hypothetical protein